MKYRKNPPKRKRAREAVDSIAARELELFIENDGQLYRSQMVPIQQNLLRKIAKGTYNHRQAWKLWMYLADSGAKKYVKESGGDWNVTMFNKPTREAVAKAMSYSFMRNVKNGEHTIPAAPKSRKKNPSHAYNVYLNGRLTDTVFMSYNASVKEVRDNLVNHDGYDSRITVRKRAVKRTNPGFPASKVRSVVRRELKGMKHVLAPSRKRNPGKSTADRNMAVALKLHPWLNTAAERSRARPAGKVRPKLFPGIVVRLEPALGSWRVFMTGGSQTPSLWRHGTLDRYPGFANLGDAKLAAKRIGGSLKHISGNLYGVVYQ